MPRYREIVGCIHIHFPLDLESRALAFMGADGEKAGVDFLLVNSHTPLEEKRALLERTLAAEGYHGRTLVIVGEEVDDNSHHNHVVVAGVPRMVGNRKNPPSLEDVLALVRSHDGISLVAHPDGFHRLFFVRREHHWLRRDIENYTGVEVWSLLFDWAATTHPFNLPVRYFGFPRNLVGPSLHNCSLWDTLSFKGKKLGYAGLDIHRVFAPWLDIRKNFEYATVFRVLRNHLLMENPLTGDAGHDRRMILDTLRACRVFFADDLLRDSRGFFFGDADERFVMGDEVPAGKRAVVRVPTEGTVRLIRNGLCVREETAAGMDVPLESPGIYRVEVLLGGKPWIFSNHIRVGE